MNERRWQGGGEEDEGRPAGRREADRAEDGGGNYFGNNSRSVLKVFYTFAVFLRRKGWECT